MFNPVSRAFFAAYETHVYMSTNFSELNNVEQELELAAALKLPQPPAPEQILALRRTFIKQKVLTRQHIISTATPRICKQYNNTDIMTLSKMYNYPPISLLRVIFKQRYPTITTSHILNANETSTHINSRRTTAAADILTALSNRDREQLAIAREHDLDSYQRVIVSMLLAEKNEALFVQNIRTRNFGPLKTQAEITAELTAAGESVRLTPDILFDEPTRLPGLPIAIQWMDYKDYVGSPISFLYRSNRQQARKYFERWGIGAIFYRYSAVEGLNIPGALVITAADCGAHGDFTVV